MKPQICLVEDDPTIRHFVGNRLEREGYTVEAFDSADGLVQGPFRWDLYVLDVKLRGAVTGIALTEKIRESNPRCPILILSALSEPANKLEGLRTGADDYLTKPFEMDELLVRVSGMLKRRSWYQSLPQNGATFSWDQNSINFSSFEGSRGGKTFPLSQKECMLMKLLIENENAVVSRSEILDRVWGYDVYPSSRTVDNFVLRLRKYFERSPSRPQYLHSVRGAGYKFTSQGRDQ